MTVPTIPQVQAADARWRATASDGTPAALWRGALHHRHLPALDGMRAIAVFIVILGHEGVRGVTADLGVSIFFVLSGFLITWLLLIEEESSGDVSLRQFYARRALRIIPAYLTYLAFSFTLDSLLGDMRWKHLLLPALTYTVNYYNALHGHPSTSVAHAWSLAIEEQFYLLWPTIFVLLAPRGRRALWRFLLLAIVVVIAIRCTLWYGLHVGTAYVYNAFETRFDNLAVGCALAVIAASPGMTRVTNVVAARAWLPILTIGALYVSRSRLGENFHYGPGLTLDAIIIAVLIVQLVVLHGHALWLWLDLPVVTYLGRLSYSLYLYHGWGLALGRKVISADSWALLPIQLLCCVLLAMCSYHVIERPFLRLKTHFSRVAA